MKYKKKEKGFTLIEILVTIIIIIILTGIVFTNYRTGQQQLVLQRAANKLAQDVRRAGEMALAAEECTPPPASCPEGGGVPAGGFGFYIDKSQDDRYFIYADNNQPSKSQWYTPGEEIETIYLEEGVYIEDIVPPSANFSINFKPPDPTIEIKDNNGNPPAGGEVTIILALEADPSKTRTITVNKAGLIEID